MFVAEQTGEGSRTSNSPLFQRLRIAAGTLLLPLAAAPHVWAQQPEVLLNVAVTCTCDRVALQKAVPFVTIASTETGADVHVVVTTKAEQWSLVAKGNGRFTGRDRTVTYDVAPAASADAVAADLGRFLKLMLAEFAAETSLGSRLDVSFRPPSSASQSQPLQQDLKDPWNYWVFRLNASSNLYGEASSSDRSYYLNASANRTTEFWKLRVAGYRSLSNSSFSLDETTKIKSRLTDWGVDGLAVKSLGPRWSLGVTGSLAGSTYSNARRIARLDPGIEFDWFPYKESTRRSLTFRYSVGPARYQYLRETIFSKLEETVWQHSLRSSLGLRQSWGSVGASAQFTQQLSALDRTRLALNAEMNIRLLKSLTLTTSGSYSRLRDQFTLEKGEATDEQVLLRQRQLATGYRYSFSVGFSYAFGALSNATVNPRFGGG
jgi:hypothetical protein